MREDLTLAAYAVSKGFTIGEPRFSSNGIPSHALKFTLKHPDGDDVIVWETSRGWRVAQLRKGSCPLSRDVDFHVSLYCALKQALQIRTSQPSFHKQDAMCFVPIPAKSDLYRKTPEELDVVLKELDSLVEEVSNARREMIHRAGGKSDHKRGK